jgi:ABC-type transport system involved in multi-copper enzyme maturation permease subunit
MVGPVLYQEMLLTGRRSQQHIFRWIYAGWLILQVAAFSYLWLFRAAPGSYALSELAEWFVNLYLVQQLILMVLATPALAAGTVSEEKSSGTLQYLLTSDLTSSEIILGKMLARSFQMGVLALVGLPLFCFLGVYAGLELLTLLAVLAETAATLLALVSASLLASVWSRQTRNAVLGLYAAGGVFLFSVWWLGDLLVYLSKLASGLPLLAAFAGLVQQVLNYFDPVYVLEPGWGARDLPDLKALTQRLFASVLAWGAVTGGCLGLAVWRLRPAYRRQLEGEGKKKQPHWWRPERVPVGEQPIAWKERHVEGMAPAAGLRRLPRWIGVLTIAALSAASSLWVLWLHLAPGATLADLFGLAARLDFEAVPRVLLPTSGGFQAQGVVVMLLASLLVGIRCSGAVSGERERQTWEALLLTPLTSRQLIRGKLWGIMGASLIYVLAYAVPALLLALVGSAGELHAMYAALREWFGAAPATPGPSPWVIPPVGWALIWLGVTLLAMYFIGAAGIWCSVRCKTSWKSLLWTVGIGYVGGFLVYIVTAPVLLLIALFVLLALMLIGEALKIDLVLRGTTWLGMYFTVFQVVSVLTLALLAWLMALFLLSSAQKYVAFRERTLQWQEEPLLRRPRRRPVRSVPS